MSDEESIVYGCIKDIVDVEPMSSRRRANRKALLSLPRLDDWPYLCQEMFSMPYSSIDKEQYQTHVIHFGASYKAVEYEWNLWMKKFESLLSNMYWVSAVVHLETELTGTHTFTWLNGKDEYGPDSQLSAVQREWIQEQSLI